MKDFYTIKDLADKLLVSTRTIKKYLHNLYKKEKNKVSIPLDVVNLIEVRHEHRQKSDTTPTQEYDIIEGFSNDEYQEFQKRLIKYPIIQKDLEQRNFIEAKDKKLE
jgi:DNA-binding MarR family transcriptional regulator